MAYFYVARNYSRTDRQHLVRVESRPFTDRKDADDWMEFLKDENPKHQLFILETQEQI